MLAAITLAAATIIGVPAPDWGELTWVQGGPLSLSDLRGKVVLVRFFTDPECPFCSATAPA
ncbi:MAG TPA: redoxin domain-containing protein, partial [Thermoanaerobaculia bacterium]